MTRPAKGTPEYDLWIAAIEVAIYPPEVNHRESATGQVSWRRIQTLREALEAVGIDWRAAAEADREQRAEARRAAMERRQAANRARNEAAGVTADGAAVTLEVAGTGFLGGGL